MHHWDDLRYLLALEENSSLTNAAKQLKTNPTTVSRHIKRLSDTFKKTLVIRQPNGEWVLTKEGATFASIAKRCSIEIGRLQETADNASTEITVSTTEFVGEHILAPRISEVISEEEDLVLSLDMRDRNVSLAFGEADLAICLGRPTAGKLVASKLADLEMNAFSVNGEMTKRWVGLTSEHDWVPEMQLGLEFFGCEPTIRSGSFSSIRDIAAEQSLACVGPSLMMDGWRGLQVMDPFSPPAKREVWSIFHESRRHDAALLRAREWAKKCFRHLPDLASA